MNRQGAFSKKNPRIVPKKSGVPRRHVVKHQQNNKSFRPTSPGVARTFFSFYVIITSTLRFSFTLRYRSGREAHRGSRLRTLAVTSQCRIAFLKNGLKLAILKKFGFTAIIFWGGVPCH